MSEDAAALALLQDQRALLLEKLSDIADELGRIDQLLKGRKPGAGAMIEI
jgi:hypothetical protein